MTRNLNPALRTDLADDITADVVLASMVPETAGVTNIDGSPHDPEAPRLGNLIHEHRLASLVSLLTDQPLGVSYVAVSHERSIAADPLDVLADALARSLASRRTIAA